MTTTNDPDENDAQEPEEFPSSQDEDDDGPKPGTYAGTCTGEVQYGVSGEDDKETVAIELLLPDGETRVWSVLFFSPAAKPYSLKKLAAIGYQAGKGLLSEQIKDKPARFSIKYETYEGERQMKVNIFDGAGGFHFKTEMTESQRDNFLASLEQEAAATPAAAGAYAKDWDKPAEPKKGGGFSLNKNKPAQQ